MNSVRVDHSFAEPYRAQPEQVTRDHQGELQQHDDKRQPRHRPPHRRGQAVDAVG
jgi:hypothetical protein